MADPNAGAAHFAGLARQLMEQDDHQPTLQRIVDLAVETIEGCDYAGISLRRGGGRVETPACTAPVIARADALQYELREGPCLDAIWVDDTYVSADLAVDPRWPRWGPQAADLGLHSILSVRLTTGADVVGGLNLYARRPHAYDEDAVVTAHVYASHAATATAVAGEIDGLRRALRSRHTIGMAQGILMRQYGVDEHAAFQVLRRMSQDSNVRLAQVAQQVVESARGPHPPDS